MKLITEKTKKEEIKLELKTMQVNVGDIIFEIDALQQELIQRYLRQDRNFLRAFYSNYTSLFMQFLTDKNKLGEPVTISIMGVTRSGKSTSGITIAGIITQLNNRLMNISHICGSQYEYMEILKENKVVQFGDAFVIDESKQAVYGTGSMAKKVKLMDIQNIIAVNNISSVYIKPDSWSFEGALYGLRAFGRGQFDKWGKLLPMRINRFMLYNLQESSAGGALPLGMVYIPHFADYLKNGKQLWKDYSAKKQAWVDEEQHGTSDVMLENMFKVGQRLTNSEIFKQIRKSSEKKVFIATALGSEVTKGEIEQIFRLTSLIQQGFTIAQIRDSIKA